MAPFEAFCDIIEEGEVAHVSSFRTDEKVLQCVSLGCLSPGDRVFDAIVQRTETSKNDKMELSSGQERLVIHAH